MSSYLNLPSDQTCHLMYGPPFPTGTPHYGHVINMVLKDILLTYHKLFGSKVSGSSVRFDTHGLPTELAVQKQLKETTGKEVEPKKLIEELGLDGYNKLCKDYLVKVIEGWVPLVNQIANVVVVESPAPSTMDFHYMNSLFTLFSELNQKGLVYFGHKVQPYSAICETAVSKFEAKQNRKEVTETSIYILFPEISNQKANFLVWTTTPFTLFSNTALCVNEKNEYALIYDGEKEHYLICLVSFFKRKLANLKKNNSSEVRFCITETFLGLQLVGKTYSPIFEENSLIQTFQIISDDYVDESGTGIVHLSPAHGEDDYRVCLKSGIISKDGDGVFDPLNSKCQYEGLKAYQQFNGSEARSCNEKIIKLLDIKGSIFQKEKTCHSLPHCWRTDKPLYFKAVESVYLDTTSLLPKMKSAIEEVNFVGGVGKDRMIGSLDQAPDWCLSRSRLWGTPIPIWINRNTNNFLVIGSAQELEQLAHLPPGSITDLHTDVVAPIVINKDEKQYQWIGYTFDCWFESGAQFYAESGYPHLTKQIPPPADFILEGQDQTRGWFYTLLVLSTAIQDRAPYKNLIMNGTVLARDGRKMAKSEKNYKELELILNEYGSDSLRLYLIGSNATKGLSFKFEEKDIREIKRKILLPFLNVGKFYVEYKKLFETSNIPLLNLEQTSPDIFDIWIESQVRYLGDTLVHKIYNYDLTGLNNLVDDFVDKLSRKYIAHGRDRFKLKSGNKSAQWALQTLHRVLLRSCVLLQPIIPETTNEIQKMLGATQIQSAPLSSLSFIVPQTGRLVEKLYDILTTVSTYRSRNQINGKKPLNKVLFGLQCQDMDLVEKINPWLEWVLLETNCLEMAFVDIEKYTTVAIEPRIDVIGKQYGPLAKKLIEWIKEHKKDLDFPLDIDIDIDGSHFNIDNTLVKRLYNFQTLDGYEQFTDNDITIYVDKEYNETLEGKFLARYVFNEFQKLRKRLSYRISDKVDAFIWSEDVDVSSLGTLFITTGNSSYLTVGQPSDMSIAVVESLDCDFTFTHGKINIALIKA